MRSRSLSIPFFSFPLLFACAVAESPNDTNTAGTGGGSGATAGSGGAAAGSGGALTGNSGAGAGGTSGGSSVSGGTGGVAGSAGGASGGAAGDSGAAGNSGTAGNSGAGGDSGSGGDSGGDDDAADDDAGGAGGAAADDDIGDDDVGDDDIGDDDGADDDSGGDDTGGGAWEDTFSENHGADCQVGEIPDRSGAMLPDPFTNFAGERITTKEQWRCRRQEIVKTMEAQVYGPKGPLPDSVSGSVTNSSIDVTVSYNGNEVSFSVGLSGAGQAGAAIVSLGAGINASLLSGQGVGTIAYSPTTFGGETGSGRGKSGLFFELYGSEVQSAGSLVAWAWGVSRILDVIEQSDQSILKADRIGVTGCSRFGKGAFSVGVWDERLALTVPVEPGSGGPAPIRGITQEGAQDPGSTYGEQPWLGDVFQPFVNNPDSLDTDMHEAVAMIAPRGLLVLDNPHIDWLGPRWGATGATAGAEVYKALGVGGNIGYHSNVENGSHCAWRSEWDAQTTAAIQRHLLKEDGAPDLAINAHSTRTTNMGDFVDWETPTLE